MKKRFMMFTLLATAFSGMVHADDAAIRQSLAKLGVQSTEIQPAPVAGMKTVLTNSGVLYVTEDGKHIIQGPMYDVERRKSGECHQPTADEASERAGKRDDHLQSAAGKTRHYRFHRHHLWLLPQAA